MALRKAFESLCKFKKKKQVYLIYLISVIVFHPLFYRLNLTFPTVVGFQPLNIQTIL